MKYIKLYEEFDLDDIFSSGPAYLDPKNSDLYEAYTVLAKEKTRNLVRKHGFTYSQANHSANKIKNVLSSEWIKSKFRGKLPIKPDSDIDQDLKTSFNTIANNFSYHNPALYKDIVNMLITLFRGFSLKESFNLDDVFKA